jgi:hypothetical protein
VSTVVTTVMLVAATGAMGAALIAWSNGSFAIKSLEVSNQAASQINLVKESFVVEDVWFKIVPYPGGTKYADVTVRNTGDLAVTISHIYVNNTQIPITSQTVPIGSVVTIQNVPVNWRSGNLQSVWVETARGTDARQDWKSI